MSEKLCSICLSEIENLEEVTHDNYKINCARCGEILITGTSYASLEKEMKDAEEFNFFARPLVSFWLRKIYNKTLQPYNYNSNDIENVLKYEKLPNVIEKTNNLILHLGSRIYPSSSFLNEPIGTYIASIGAIDEDELLYIQQIVYKNGYLRFSSRGEKEIQLNHPAQKMGLSYPGWVKFDELKRGSINSNKTFVAMWFHDTTELLRDSLRSAISAAGYDPIIVDERHFTGNIMDYIIGQIKQSKFLIADFTVQPESSPDIEESIQDEPENSKVKNGVRGGVYFESGFAKGLGLEVIHTCKNDNISKNRLHFDILQENTLFWDEGDLENIEVRGQSERLANKSPQNFAEKIYDRIVRIFGYGVNVSS